MNDFQNKVLIGNVTLYPEVIKQQLRKSYYFLTYDPEKEKLTLTANHGRGGENLFEIRNVPYESAAKLAYGLGLKGEGKTPLTWLKWNPILFLYHDGSEDAHAVCIEILKLGIPYLQFPSPTLALSDGHGKYQPPMWSVEKILDIVRKTAERYKDALNSKP